MNASIGFRTRLFCVTGGSDGRTGLRKAQNWRSASVTWRSLLGPACSAIVRPVSFAPFSIQCRISTFSASVSLFLLGGILLAAILIHSKLSSGEPGLTAGPDSPPLRSPALLRRSKSAFCKSLPWQRRHLDSRIGSTSFSKSGSTGLSAAEESTAPADTRSEASNMAGRPREWESRQIRIIAEQASAVVVVQRGG